MQFQTLLYYYTILLDISIFLKYSEQNRVNFNYICIVQKMKIWNMQIHTPRQYQLKKNSES